MKATMLSKQKMDYLFHHILDGFKVSARGLNGLKRDRLIDDKEYLAMLEKNSDRLIERIEEFKITQKLLSVFFAGLFIALQVMDSGMDLRRGRRTRGARRRFETEQTI